MTWISRVDASFTCTICLKNARCSFQKHPQKTTCFGLYIYIFFHLHSSPTGRETGGHGNIDVIDVCEKWTFRTLVCSWMLLVTKTFRVVKIMGGKKTAKYSVLKSTLLTQGIIEYTRIPVGLGCTLFDIWIFSCERNTGAGVSDERV